MPSPHQQYQAMVLSLKTASEHPVENLKTQTAVEVLYDLYYIYYSVENMPDVPND